MEVPAGKLKVMETFFSPVHQQRLEGGGASNKMDLRGGEWMEGRDEMLFYSSLSSTSFSSDASVEEESFRVPNKLDTWKHSQSCVDVRTFRKRNVDFDRPKYSRLSSKSEDRLFQEEEEEEEKELEDAALYKPSNLGQSVEIPTPRQREYSVHEPNRTIVKNGSRTNNLRKAKSMEVIALKLRHGPSTAAPTAKVLAVPGASSDGKKHKGNERAGVELTAAKERFVQQKVKFSQFLDEITVQVLSPSSLNSLSLKQQDQGIRGNGNANKKYKVKDGILQDRIDGKIWREEVPVQHRADRMESGRRSICSTSSRQPGNHGVALLPDTTSSPELGSKNQPKQEGLRHMDVNMTPEHSPAPTKQNPSATRCHYDPNTNTHTDITLYLEQNPALPKQSTSPTTYHYKQDSSKLTDSASSLENCLTRSMTLGKPSTCKYTDSSPEDCLAVEGHPQTAGNGSGDNSCRAKELLTDDHRLTFLQEENEDLQRRLACASYKMEKMDSEFKASHGYLETELHRARADLGDLREKFWRLQENYTSTQQANDFMGEKLSTMAQSMETERKSVNQRISELTNRLTSAQSTICTLEKINEMVSKHGHDQLEASVDHSSFLDVTVFTPPASFMDEGPETDTGAPSLSECPIRSAVEPGTGAEQLHSGVGTVPEDNGLHCPEEQVSLMGQEEPKRQLRTSGSSGPHSLTAFTPWKSCPEAIPPLEWFETLKGNEPQADGGKTEKRHLPSCGRFAACDDDLFGPIAPEKRLTAATGTTSEGRRREFSPNRQQPPPKKDMNPKSHNLLRDPWGEVSGSAGSEDKTLESWSKTVAGKIPADGERGQELDHSVPSGFVKTFQRNGSGSAYGSDGKAVQGDKRSRLLSSCLPGAKCDPSPQSGLGSSKRWANQWDDEIGYQLLEEDEWSNDDDAMWRPQEILRARIAPDYLRVDPGATARARPAFKRSQAMHGPVARDQTL